MSAPIFISIVFLILFLYIIGMLHYTSILSTNHNRQYHISKLTKKSGKVVYSVCYYRKSFLGGSWEYYPQEYETVVEAKQYITHLNDQQTVTRERLLDE